MVKEATCQRMPAHLIAEASMGHDDPGVITVRGLQSVVLARCPSLWYANLLIP